MEPWAVREKGLDLDVLARSESVFALSNGHVGLRGNLDEGEPHSLPGTYLNSVYEYRPLPYAEAGYGYPESGQTVINVTNGKILRLLVDDEPFDVRYGTVMEHERVLDLRAGTLFREVHWRSPAGRAVRIRSTRLVSFTHRSIVAIAVRGAGGRGRRPGRAAVRTRGERGGAGGGQRIPGRRPCSARRWRRWSTTRRVCGCSSSTAPGAARSASLSRPTTWWTCSDGLGFSTASEIRDDWGRVTVTSTLRPGDTLKLTKFVSYGWSSVRSRPALRDQVAAGLTGALHTGWQGLLDDQREFLDRFWEGADVLVEGDPALQQAVRFALFHVLQNSVRAEERPIAAKGLTGPGYDGHCFWDTDSFVAARPRAHLARGGRGPPALAARARSTRPGTGRRRSTCAGRRSRGGRSTARSARGTGRRARRPSTSMPTSRTP